MKNRHEVLFNQLKEYRNETLYVVSDLTEEQADIIPKSFNNNIRWNLGHIYLDQYLWIQTVTKENIELAEAFHESFGFGTSPQNWSDNVPSFDLLKELLQKQPEIIQERYGNRLEEVFPPTEMGMHTIEQVLVRTMYHEGLHVGALQLIKRFVM